MTQGFNDLDNRFSARSKRFQQEFQYLKDPENAFGVRFTAMPAEDQILLDPIFRFPTIAEEFKEPWPRVFIQEDGREKRLLKDEQIFSSLRWWSIPNGGARQAPVIGDTKLPVHSYRELHRDGLIEMGFVSQKLRDHDCEKNLYFCLLSDLPVVTFANLVVWADQIRSRALSPTAKYLVEMEVCTKGGYVIVTNDYAAKCFAIRNKTIFPQGTKKFLRCLLHSSERIPELVECFYHNFWNFFDTHPSTEEVVFTMEDLTDD